MPRYCSACGAPLGVHAPIACTACGSPNWLNAIPGAAGLVVHRGHLLLTRRAIEPWRGMWCAPGGFCDGPEHPASCAEREVFEETGVRARVIGYLGHWIDEYAPGNTHAPLWGEREPPPGTLSRKDARLCDRSVQRFARRTQEPSRS